MTTPLPGTRDELLGLHRDASSSQRRRTAARNTRRDHLIARIEVEVARIERAMDPPLV
jgi:hypothetical protein